MEVDLGTVKDMNRFDMICYSDCAYRYKVEVKNAIDGTYTQVVDRLLNTRPGKATDPIIDVFPTISVRYLKLTVTGEANNASGYASITEIRAFNIPANIKPTVSLIEPLQNSVFSANSPIQFTANASDRDGSISKVQFYRGSVLIGEVAQSPYTITWDNPAQGNYQIAAVAYDNNNEFSTSAAASIQVMGLTAIQAPLDSDYRIYVKNGNCYISTSSTETATLTLFNPVGKILHRKQFRTETEIVGLQKGIYIITIKTKDKTNSSKIVLF